MVGVTVVQENSKLKEQVAQILARPAPRGSAFPKPDERRDREVSEARRHLDSLRPPTQWLGENICWKRGGLLGLPCQKPARHEGVC